MVRRSFQGGFFTAWRLTLYGSGVVVIYAVSLIALLFKGKWVILPDGSLQKMDFGTIWVSGNLATSSDPASIFNNSAFLAAQIALYGTHGWPVIPYFVYPPTFLLLTYPLGLMPYLAAFAVWVFTTLALYLTAIWVIIPRPTAVILALTPSTVVFNLGLGQNGFLTAGLIGLTLALTECRPWLSGIFLGLLTYKPQFGILFPLALLASRNWRALVSATIASVLLGVASTIAFGYQGWLSFVHSLLGRQPNLAEIPGWQPPLVSVFGFLQSAGASAQISWSVHLAAAAMVAVTIGVLWAKPIPHCLKAAALCIGSVMVTPYVLGYDLCILTIAVAFVVKDALSRGFLPTERAIMLACWAGLIFLVAPMVEIAICAILLVLVVRRAATIRETAASTARSPTGPSVS